MITKTLGGLSVAEFNELIGTYIEREDPHAISLDVLAELDAESRQREMPADFEFLGRVVQGRLRLVPLLKTGPTEIHGNEIIFPNGWRVIVQVKPPAPAKA